MQIVIDIPKDKYDWIMRHLTLDLNFKDCKITSLPEQHGDLKDIGNMELLNVQVHDDYSKGWHNAIEYCVRQLRERTTVIPATKEGE